MLIVSWLICGVSYFIFCSYMYSKLILKQKYKLSKIEILYAIIFSVINALALYFQLGYLKPFIMALFFFIGLLIIYKKELMLIVLGVGSEIVITLVAELIYGIVMIIIFNVDLVKFNTTAIGYIISNLTILIICIPIINLPIVVKKMNTIIEWYNKNETKILMIISILLVTIGTFILYNNFISILPPSLLFLTNLFCITVLAFVVVFFKEKTNNKKMIYEYDQLLDYVKIYEKLIEEKSKNQHEYKNQLILIRDISLKKDRINYINNILHEDDNETDINWLNKLRYIPQGGIKGLIYYKIQEMIKNDINIYVNISEKLNNSKSWKNCDKNLSSVSKVIGVYLDNAIEAVKESKEKYITLNVYLENSDILFEISNTYSNAVDVTKIDKEGYSTKGKGKGYGLSLVKDIIEKNKSLEQRRILNGRYYTQVLIIKK